MSGIQQMLLGGRGVVISLPDSTSDTAVAADPSNATAAVYIRDDGEMTRAADGFVQNWCEPPGAVADYLTYEFRMTKDSGDDLTSGTLNTWIAASLNPSWTLTVSSVGTATFNGTLEVRPPSGTEFDSCTVTLEAEVTS